MTDPINGTAPHVSLGARLRRRIPWSDWQATGELDRIVDSFRLMRELSLDVEEQHRASCPEDEDHELVYSMDGESVDRLILALERVQATLRWYRLGLFRSALLTLASLALSGVALGFAVTAMMRRLLW